MPKSSLSLPEALSSKQALQLARVQERYPAFAELEEFVQRVSVRKPLLVLLFGSLATGQFTQHSDADVLVIFNRSVDWMSVYECSAGRVQPLVRELGEALGEIEAGNTLLIEALEDGIPLLDRAGAYERLRCACWEAKRRLGLVRTRRGWQRAAQS